MATQVSSKGRFRYCDGFGPSFIADADGCKVLGSDSKWYIDWTMGLGALTLGHKRGLSGDAVAWPLPSITEVLLAEKIQERMPAMAMMRFLKSGTDATSAAVRLARAHTGRDKIVRCGYHGWQDWALNADYADKEGVPQCVRDLTVSVKYGDCDQLTKELMDSSAAAFILEPAPLQGADAAYLSFARQMCNEFGTALIFDEVISGFRMAPGGVQEALGIKPDLTAAGKALANGHAISVVGGKREIMESFCDTHISGTHFGEVHAMRAAIYTMEQMEKPNQGTETANFWAHQEIIGGQLIKAYRAAVEHRGLGSYTKIRGAPFYSVIEWNDPLLQTLWQQEMLRRGVLVASGQFISMAHDKAALDATIFAYQESMKIVAEAIDAGDAAKRVKCKTNMTVFKRHA